MAAADRLTAEKLIILRNYTQGLLTRAYACVKYAKGPKVKIIPSRVLDALAKKVDDPLANIEKVNGHEMINDLAADLEKECSFVYATVEDIINATSEMESFFTSLASSIASFDLDNNPDLTQRFMDVFCNYVKMHLLASRFKDAKVAVYIYLRAFYFLKKNETENCESVKSYLARIRDPIKYLQTQMEGKASVGDSLIECLSKMFMKYMSWNGATIIKQKRTLDIMQDPETLPQPLPPKINVKCLDGQICEKFTTWVLYTYLCFPEKLANESYKAQLGFGFEDKFCVNLFRDEVFEMRSTYNNMKVHKQMKVRLPSLNKVYKPHTDKLVAQRHRDLRTYYLEKLKDFVDLLDTLPGVIPAKLPILLTGLSLARSEVMWIFEHLQLLEQKSGKKISKDKVFAGEFNKVTELMYYIQLLAKKLEEPRMKRLVSDYYKDKLTMYLEQLVPVLQELQGQIDSDALQLLDLIRAQLEELPRAERILILEGLRLNWYRTSAILSSAGAHNKKPKVKECIKIMNNIVQSSRYYDYLSKEVERCTSFAELWFFRKQIPTFFNNIISVFKKSKDASQYIKMLPDQTRYLMVYLKVFEQAMSCVHKQYPSERHIIGGEALKKAELYIASASSCVKDCCARLVDGFSELADQLDGDVMNKMSKRKRGDTGMRPGHESLVKNERMPLNPNSTITTSTIRAKMEVMGKVCAAFRETEKIIVFNKYIFPNAYLYDELESFFRQQVKRQLLVNREKKKNDGSQFRDILRPSAYLKRLGHLLRAFHIIGAHVNIEIEHMIRKVMFDECNDAGAGYVGQTVLPKRKKEKDENMPIGLVQTISMFYTHLITSCVETKYNRVYSPFENGFYDLKPMEPSIQDYTTPNELQALCRLIGPGGVRVIDQDMVRLSLRCIGDMKLVLLANSVVINKDLDVYSSESWSETAKSFRHLDKLTDAATLYGLILCFRKNLRNALAHVAEEKTPFMKRSVSLIHSRLEEANYDHKKFNQMALDFGVVSPLSDSMMHTVVLGKLKEDSASEADSELEIYRRAIPILFGFIFTSDSWKNVQFHVPTGALQNNGMCIAHTLKLLFDALTLNSGSKRHAHSKSLKIHFLRYASITLLNMNTPQFRQTYSAHRSRDLLVFLDYFIRLNEDLSVAELEQAGVPYAMIRAQYVRLYGAANDITRTEGLVDVNTLDEMTGEN